MEFKKIILMTMIEKKIAETRIRESGRRRINECWKDIRKIHGDETKTDDNYNKRRVEKRKKEQ